MRPADFARAVVLIGVVFAFVVGIYAAVVEFAEVRSECEAQNGSYEEYNCYYILDDNLELDEICDYHCVLPEAFEPSRK